MNQVDPVIVGRARIAFMLGRSERTVSRWVRQGLLPVVKAGPFDNSTLTVRKAEIDKLMPFARDHRSVGVLMPRHDALPPNLPPRGLSREAAAQYVGVSVTKFDELVERGRMPRALRIDSRKVWDRKALDRAFDQLGDAAGHNEWDGGA